MGESGFSLIRSGIGVYSRPSLIFGRSFSLRENETEKKKAPLVVLVHVGDVLKPKNVHIKA